MAKKKKPQKITTPVGVGKFAYIKSKDTEFNPDGDYRIQLELPEADAADLMEKITKAHEDAVKAAKKETGKKKVKEQDLPFYEREDEDGAGTGIIAFKFKQKSIVRPKNSTPFKKTVAVFDAAGKKMPAIDPWGGSKVKVCFSISPYYTASSGAGVTLRLIAIQIIELAEAGGDAETFGFGEEDGYSFDEETWEGNEETPDDEGEEDDGQEPEDF